MIHNLLDSKINHILQLSLDESILDSVQSIIQNMISSGESLQQNDSNSQQLSYLQSCGFGGLWRFAQPFAMLGREKPENVELFIDCLEAMVETCLPPDNDSSFSSSTCTATVGVPTMGGGGEQSATGGSSVTPLINGSSHNSQATMTSSHSSKNPTTTSRSRHSHSNLSATNSFLHLSSSSNLIGGGSMSSISMGSIHSPTDIDLFDINDGSMGATGTFRRSSRIRRNSSPRIKD